MDTLSIATWNLENSGGTCWWSYPTKDYKGILWKEAVKNLRIPRTKNSTTCLYQRNTGRLTANNTPGDKGILPTRIKQCTLKNSLRKRKSSKKSCELIKDRLPDDVKSLYFNCDHKDNVEISSGGTNIFLPELKAEHIKKMRQYWNMRFRHFRYYFQSYFEINKPCIVLLQELDENFIKEIKKWISWDQHIKFIYSKGSQRIRTGALLCGEGWRFVKNDGTDLEGALEVLYDDEPYPPPEVQTADPKSFFRDLNFKVESPDGETIYFRNVHLPAFKDSEAEDQLEWWRNLASIQKLHRNLGNNFVLGGDFNYGLNHYQHYITNQDDSTWTTVAKIMDKLIKGCNEWVTLSPDWLFISKNGERRMARQYRYNEYELQNQIRALSKAREELNHTQEEHNSRASDSVKNEKDMPNFKKGMVSLYCKGSDNSEDRPIPGLTDHLMVSWHPPYKSETRPVHDIQNRFRLAEFMKKNFYY